MDTDQMLRIALQLAGLSEAPGDTAILVPGKGIHRVLMGIDMDTPELLLARQLGYDCVVSHHPRNASRALLNVFDRHVDLMTARGVPEERVRALVAEKKAARSFAWHTSNLRRSQSAAQLLGMPYLCIHSPADILAEARVQSFLDARFAHRRDARLSEVIAAMGEIPEYAQAERGPMIRAGSPDAACGEIAVSMSGLSNLGAEGLRAYFDAGVGTVIHMHIAERDAKLASEWGAGNAIAAGHMASDSIGMNEIARAWEQAGLEITAMSGMKRA